MGFLRAGNLDRRITIERATLTDNGMCRVPGWATLRTCWAMRRPDRGGERADNDQRQATAAVVYRVRWWAAAASVSPADRIVDQDIVFDIVSVLEIGRREGLEIAARAVVGRA